MQDPKIKGYIINESPSIMNKPEIVSSNNVDRVIIKTTLQDADVRNRNKRIYPKTVLQKGLEAPFVKERLATKTFFGEAGHPLKPDIQRQLYLDQSNISHRVNEVWWEGNILKGYVEAANTARGKDFDGLVRQGCKVAFSLRAVGPITEKRGDTVTVKDPLSIFSYDWVIHPSHASAYMDEIISEDANMSLMHALCESSNSMFEPFYEDATQYLMEMSNNLKIICDSMGIDINNKKYGKTIMVNEDVSKIYIRDQYDTVIVKPEEYLSDEISRYMGVGKFGTGTLNENKQIFDMGKNSELEEGFSFGFGKKKNQESGPSNEEIQKVFGQQMRQEANRLKPIAQRIVKTNYPDMLKAMGECKDYEDEVVIISFDPYDLVDNLRENPHKTQRYFNDTKSIATLLNNQLKDKALFRVKRDDDGDWDSNLEVVICINKDEAKKRMRSSVSESTCSGTNCQPVVNKQVVKPQPAKSTVNVNKKPGGAISENAFASGGSNITPSKPMTSNVGSAIKTMSKPASMNVGPSNMPKPVPMKPLAKPMPMRPVSGSNNKSMGGGSNIAKAAPMAKALGSSIKNVSKATASVFGKMNEDYNDELDDIIVENYLQDLGRTLGKSKMVQNGAKKMVNKATGPINAHIDRQMEKYKKEAKVVASATREIMASYNISANVSVNIGKRLPKSLRVTIAKIPGAGALDNINHVKLAKQIENAAGGLKYGSVFIQTDEVEGQGRKQYSIGIDFGAKNK